MASYQNTSGYYCGITENTHPGYYPYPSVYNFNQNPTNFYTNADYPEIIHNTGNVNGHVPQYNTIQYTPRTQHPVFHQEPKPHNINQDLANRHHAHITILPSSKGTFKASIKRKRKRTKFTTEQVEALEAIFRNHQYVSRDERLVIVNQLKLDDKAVKTWFQNRRLKAKSMQNSDSEEQGVSCSNAKALQEDRISSSSVIARLNSVEYKTLKKSDANGFITLDDGVMKDLFSVIDDCLTKNSVVILEEEFVRNNVNPVDKPSLSSVTDHQDSVGIPVAESDNSSFYEPISPAAVSNITEEDSSISWSPSEPAESLRILFDLQARMLL